MRRGWTAAVLAVVCAAMPASAQQVLPEGARTRWVVEGPEEVVGWLLFDPATVADRLPPALRFITVAELAEAHVAWAREERASHPSRGSWGVSFIEIVRANTFTIDGRAPDVPEHGAVGLWLARVAPASPEVELGPGRPYLVLDLWVPDAAYVAYMRARGHQATVGRVRIRRSGESWRGAISAEGLRVRARCTPTGPTAGPGGVGMQLLIPPAASPVDSRVLVVFSGHHVRECAEDRPWTIRGTHPLAHAAPVGPATFQYGYSLFGGAYH